MSQARQTPTIISSPAPPARPKLGIYPQAVYLHIPFCRRRCHYCDFAIAITGEFTPIRRNAQGVADPNAPKTPIDGSNSGRIARYVDTLIQEISIQAIPPDPPPLQTISFGGGTPSLLSVEQFGRILAALGDRFPIAPSAEISMEMDPGTFNRDKLAGFLKLGLNRISLGIQAFQDELLEICGRLHRVADGERAIAMIQEFGVKNWSLDLITGLPHQTGEHWTDSLERAIAANPAHISIYDLAVEPGTVFEKRYEPGEAPLPSEAIAADFYRQGHQRLTDAGYDHYEISNYAKPGHTSRHNLVYWRNQPYYGFGMAATSYVDQTRFSRPRTTHSYEQWVMEGAMIDAEPVTPVDRWLETLMVGLRLAEGLSLGRLIGEFGRSPVQKLLLLLRSYEQQGWVNGVLPNLDRCDCDGHFAEGAIALQAPDGFLLSNEILSTLFQHWMDMDTLE